MKKTYSTPVMSVEKFDVIDVITTVSELVYSSSEAAQNKEMTNNEYTVAVGAEW